MTPSTVNNPIFSFINLAASNSKANGLGDKPALDNQPNQDFDKAIDNAVEPQVIDKISSPSDTARIYRAAQKAINKLDHANVDDKVEITKDEVQDFKDVYLLVFHAAKTQIEDRVDDLTKQIAYLDLNSVNGVENILAKANLIEGLRGIEQSAEDGVKQLAALGVPETLDQCVIDPGLMKDLQFQVNNFIQTAQEQILANSQAEPRSSTDLQSSDAQNSSYQDLTLLKDINGIKSSTIREPDISGLTKPQSSIATAPETLVTEDATVAKLTSTLTPTPAPTLKPFITQDTNAAELNLTSKPSAMQDSNTTELNVASKPSAVQDSNMTQDFNTVEPSIILDSQTAAAKSSNAVELNSDPDSQPLLIKDSNVAELSLARDIKSSDPKSSSYQDLALLRDVNDIQDLKQIKIQDYKEVPEDSDTANDAPVEALETVLSKTNAKVEEKAPVLNKEPEVSVSENIPKSHESHDSSHPGYQEQFGSALSNPTQISLNPSDSVGIKFETINIKDLSNYLEAQVRDIPQNKTQEIRLQITPDSIGKVDLVITRNEHNEISVQMSFHSKDGLDTIKQDLKNTIAELREVLKSKDLDLSKFEVKESNSSHTAYNGESSTSSFNQAREEQKHKLQNTIPEWVKQKESSTKASFKQVMEGI